MRVLIIATPRSGSTNLTNIIANMLGCKRYQEPYNFGHPSAASQEYPDTLPNNVVVKTMYSQLPLGYIEGSREFYLEEIKKFDKVILLSRLDIKASYESFNYRLKNNPKGNWHTEYTYDEFNVDLNVYNSFLKWTSDLIEFSKTINTPVTWYEDIFENKNKDAVKYWDLDIDVEIFYKHVSQRPRYRKTNIKNTII